MEISLACEEKILYNICVDIHTRRWDMFYKEITVPIPAKKRIAWKKNKPYVTEIFSRKGKKAEDDCVVVGIALGRDSDKMYPNHRYFERHPEEAEKLKDGLSKEYEFCPTQSVGQHLLIDAVCDETGLDAALAESFPGFSQEIEACMKYYLSARDTDMSGFSCYGYDHYLGTNYIPDLGKLFNERMTHEKIRGFLSVWLRSRLSLSDSPEVEIDFDSTNANTSSGNIGLAERGKAKTDEGLPQVNFSYLVDRDTGIPMHFDIFYGSIVDMEHCKNCIRKVEAINKDTKFCLCMDRGYYTKPFLESICGKYNFCVMGKDGVMMDRFVSDYPESVIKKSDNRVYGSVYGVRFRSSPFREWDKGDLFIYLYYDPSRANAATITDLDRLETVAEQLAGKKDAKGNIRRTWEKKLDIKFDSKTKVITSAKINHAAFDERLRKAGYFYIVSDRDMDCRDMLRFYRHRDVIEKDFMHARSQEDLAKTYAQNDGCYEAKTFMGFLCAIVRSSILKKMEPYFTQYRSETSQSVINEMGKVKLEKLNGSIIPLCPLTGRQKQIMSFYNLTNRNLQDLANEFVTIGFPE